MRLDVSAVLLDLVTVCQIVKAVGIVTVRLSIVVIVLAVLHTDGTNSVPIASAKHIYKMRGRTHKAFLASLGVSAVSVRARVPAAVRVIAVGHSVAIVILVIKALPAGLLAALVLAAPTLDSFSIGRIIQAVRILAVGLSVLIVIASVEALLARLGPGAVALCPPVLLAVRVVAIGHSVVVVVDAIEALLASLMVGVDAAAVSGGALVLQTVFVLAVGLAVPVVITSVEALLASLRVLAVGRATWVFPAVGIIAIEEMVLVVVNSVKARLASLVVDVPVHGPAARPNGGVVEAVLVGAVRMPVVVIVLAVLHTDGTNSVPIDSA